MRVQHTKCELVLYFVFRAQFVYIHIAIDYLYFPYYLHFLSPFAIFCHIFYFHHSPHFSIIFLRAYICTMNVLILYIVWLFHTQIHIHNRHLIYKKLYEWFIVKSDYISKIRFS